MGKWHLKPFQSHLIQNRLARAAQDLGQPERPTLECETYVLPSLNTGKAGKPEKTTGLYPVADTNVTKAQWEED